MGFHFKSQSNDSCSVVKVSWMCVRWLRTRSFSKVRHVCITQQMSPKCLFTWPLELYLDIQNYFPHFYLFFFKVLLFWKAGTKVWLTCTVRWVRMRSICRQTQSNVHSIQLADLHSFDLMWPGQSLIDMNHLEQKPFLVHILECRWEAVWKRYMNTLVYVCLLRLCWLYVYTFVCECVLSAAVCSGLSELQSGPEWL